MLSRIRAALKLRSRGNVQAFEPSWIPTDDGSLDTTGMTFRLKLLGMEAIGDCFNQRCCLCVLRRLAKTRKKRKPEVLLLVTCAGVQMVQYPWTLAAEHDIECVSYCAYDPATPRLFAYVLHDVEVNNYVCVCFKTLRNATITGIELVETFVHSFSCAGGEVQLESEELETVGTNDKEAETLKCRCKGLVHFQSKIFHTSSCQSSLEPKSSIVTGKSGLDMRLLSETGFVNGAKRTLSLKDCILNHGRVSMAENGNLLGQQPANQTSIMPPPQLYSAVENAFMKLKPKIYPPPSPPSIYPTLQDNAVPHIDTLPEVQNSSFKTTKGPERTTPEAEHQWTTIDGELRWNTTDGEEQLATTNMEALGDEEDAYASRAQQESPAPLNLHCHISDYYCHCCSDQSLICAIMDLDEV